MRKSEKLISIIIPCFNEEEAITLFHKEISNVSNQMSADFEFIFIDDGSKDKTLEAIKNIRKKDKRVRFISFSRNFGKEAGMYAGLKVAKGDYVAVMDVDMQDPPKMLITMYDEIKDNDYDCVALYTSTHKDYSFIRRTLTKGWYKFHSDIMRSNEKPGSRDFRLMTRQMVDAILSMKEKKRYIKGIYNFIGFKTKWIEFQTPNRAVGTSKFPLKKLFAYAIQGIVAFSVEPLKIPLKLGIASLFISLIWFIAIIIMLCKRIAVSLFLSLGCLIVFLFGINLLMVGILAKYISESYLEIKERPVYIIRETEESND